MSTQETIIEMVCDATGVTDVTDAVAVLNSMENGWEQFVDMANDPRMFEVDREWTVAEVKAALKELV